METIISNPAFSDIAFSYFGKTYYSNRSILEDQSYLIEGDKTSTIIKVPSVKGPFDKFLNFLYGNKLEISKQDTAFYLIMDDFFVLKNENLSNYFINNSQRFSHKDAHIIYQYLLEHSNPHRQDKKFLILLKTLDRYINIHPDPVLPAFIVQIALENIYYAANCFNLQNSIKIFQILLKELSYCNKVQFAEITDVIQNFLVKFPVPELIELPVRCPYFDLDQIASILQRLLVTEKDTEFLGEKGFFESNPYNPTQPYFYSSSADISQNLDESHDIYQINNFQIASTYILNGQNSYFIFGFKNRTFDLVEYSFKMNEEQPLPVSWILYATCDMKNYSIIDRVENNTKRQIRKKVSKPFPFACAYKFEILKSTLIDEYVSINININTVDNFDIFGIYHHSFDYQNSNALFNQAVEEARRNAPAEPTPTNTNQNNEENSEHSDDESSTSLSYYSSYFSD